MVSGSTTIDGSTRNTRSSFPQPWAYPPNIRHHPTSSHINEWLPGLYQSWFVPMKTSCDESRVPPTERQLSDSWQHQQQKYPSNNHQHAIGGPVSPDNPYKEQIEKLRNELEEPCQACLYTGVSVCIGLSVYFANLAIDDTTLAKNRRFLWMCSAGSVAAGAYRWYLG